MMFEGFQARNIPLANGAIHVRVGGSGPPVLLLHGFPETHLMWRDVAGPLARRYTVICADLPGQGQSAPFQPPSSLDYSKRRMAEALAEMMKLLGFGQFSVAGHDRGARVAYRMALDLPDRISKLAALDIIPTIVAWECADQRLAKSFWPWVMLSQPAPLPERMILGAPEAVVDDAIHNWGTEPDCFPADVRLAYVDALRDPESVHAICQEFRCAAGIDIEDDAADRLADRGIACPMLVLWDGEGAVGKWYEDSAGPLGIWARWADKVTGYTVHGGHFFPESNPETTAEALADFFSPAA